MASIGLASLFPPVYTPSRAGVTKFVMQSKKIAEMNFPQAVQHALVSF